MTGCAEAFVDVIYKGFCKVFGGFFCQHFPEANSKILKSPWHFIADVLRTWISEAEFRVMKIHRHSNLIQNNTVLMQCNIRQSSIIYATKYGSCSYLFNCSSKIQEKRETLKTCLPLSDNLQLNVRKQKVKH